MFELSSFNMANSPYITVFCRRFAAHMLFISILLFSLQAVAGDDYMQLLEAEAEELELDQSSQIQKNKPVETGSTASIKKTDWKWDGDLENTVLPSGLTQDEFASLLKQHFYGTFVFYRKLTSIDKQTVYYHYTKASSADLDIIRKDILEHIN
jgi:hypothetical protein